MGKEFQVEIKSEPMEKMLAEMERAVGPKIIKRFIDFEAGKVLRSAAEKTKQAGVGKINSQLKRLKGKGARAKTPQWQAIVKKEKAEIDEKKRRVGLARQTWLYLARLVQLDTSGGRGLGKARKATVDGRKIAHDGSARRVSRGRGSYAIEIVYRNPVGRFVGAAGALRRAINGRQKFFRNNVRTGVFKSAKAIAAKYPGIQITKR